MNALTAATLLCLSVPAWAPDEPKKPREKPPARFLERYDYQADLTGYPQKTPRDTLESIIKALVNQRIDYMMAHLADPAYVDGKVASYARGGRIDEAAPTIFSERLGASVSAPDAATRKKHKMNDRVGIVLSRVQGGSAADSAGLQNDDMLLFMGEDPKKPFIVANPPGDFVDLMNRLPPGLPFYVTVVRGGKDVIVKTLVLPDLEYSRRLDAFRRVVRETTTLYFEDAACIQELRLFARDAEWKIEADAAGVMRARGTLKQLGNRHVYLILREERWFLENRQTKKEI